MGKAQGLAAIFTLCLMHLGAQAYNLLAQSSVQICPKNGSAAELKCDAKIVVTVTVAGDEVGDADPIVLDRVRDEESGVLKDLQTAIQIKISKSQVRLFYALHYEQDYWFAPSEDVYKDYNDCTCNTENPHSVPCGVIYDNFGNAVPYSCGKCCAQKRDCRRKDHDGDTYCRGQMTSHHSKVASCLNNPGSGGDQYSAFSVNTPKKDFTISITILGPGTHQSVLTLSPSILVQKDGKGIVLATLTGEFASFQSPLQFDDQFLVVPVPKDTFSPTVEAQARLEWLMLSKDKFGRELGKIGFTYEAFFSQQAFCQQPKGSGIGGQLVNYVEEDMANEVSGRELKYSVLRYKDIIGGDAKADPRLWNALWFNCTGCGQSVVTMEIAADSIAFLPSVAPGKIIAAHVPNFVALSFQSIASVTIQNVGTIAAGFSLSGLQFSLDPNAQQTFNMSLRTTMSNVNVTQDTFQCAITLLDSRAGLVDNRTVSFTISSTVRTNGSDEVLLGPSTIVDPYDKKSSGLFNFGFFDCSKHCVDPKDGTMCYILHLCFKKIMGLFAGVVTTIIAVIVLLVLWRLGILTGLCRLLSGCCKSCCKGRGKGRSDRKRRHGKGAKQKAKKRKGRKKIKKNHGRSKHDSEVGDEDEEKKPKQGTGIPEGEEGELPADVENPASKLEEVAGVAERPDSGKKVAKPGTDVTQKVLEKGKESLQGLGGKMFKGFKGMFKGAKAGANSPPLQEPPPNAPPTPTVDTASPTPPLSTSPLGATAAAPGQQPPPPPPMPLQPAAAAAAAAPAPAQPGPQTVYLAPPPIQTTPQAQIIYASPGPQPQPQPQLQFQAPPGPPRAQFGPPQPPQYAPSSAWPPQFAATQPPMRPLLPPQGRGFPPGFNPMGAPLAQSGPPPQFRAPPPGQPQMPPSGAFRPQFAAGPPRPQFPTDLMSMQPPQPRPGNYGQPSQQQQFGTLQGMRPPPGGPQPWPAAPQGMSQLRPAAPPQGLFTFQAGAPLAPLAPGTQQLRPPGARPLGPPPGFPFMRPNDRG